MIKSAAKAILGIAITMGIAAGAIVIGNDRYVDTDGAFAQACAGKPATPQLENALFNSRARSDGGMDAICAPAAVDDDYDGALLSRSPSDRNNAARLEMSGVRAAPLKYP
jgi:hypothetical protein